MIWLPRVESYHIRCGDRFAGHRVMAERSGELLLARERRARVGFGISAQSRLPLGRREPLLGSEVPWEPVETGEEQAPHADAFAVLPGL